MLRLQLSTHCCKKDKLVEAGGQGKTLKQETNIGVLPVTCYEDGRIVMTQTEPIFGVIEEDRARIAALLGIEPQSLLDYSIQIVSTGTPKLMIPVDSLQALRMVKPNLEGIKEYCKNGAARGFYPFTTETIDPRADFQARQFNPLVGINEDPITGVAAGALGCYAKKYGLTTKSGLVIEQGYTMGLGGQMFVDVSAGLKMGGYAVMFGKREFGV